MRWIDPRSRLAGLVAGLVLVASGAVAQGPLSANDWLKGKPAPPASSAWRPGDPVPPDASRLRPTRPPMRGQGREVAATAAAVPVGVSRLGAANSDGAGVISARQAGLPENFWDGTDLDTAIRLLQADPTLPASSQIARRVIEAQLPPPTIPAEGRIGEFFIARVDQLIADGALPSARVLLQGAGPDNAAAFRRLFDMSLLLGGEDEVCARMNTAPGIAPDPAARIFCLAQSGDWPGAATVFIGARKLAMIDPHQAELLPRYLDDSTADGAAAVLPHDPMSPLSFRLHEAIGQPLPTTDLALQ